MAELLLMSSAIAGLMGLPNRICSDPVRRRDPAYVGLASLCKVVAVLKTIPALVRPPACKQLTATRESHCSGGSWLSGEVLLGPWPATHPDDVQTRMFLDQSHAAVTDWCTTRLKHRWGVTDGNHRCPTAQIIERRMGVRQRPI